MISRYNECKMILWFVLDIRQYILHLSYKGSMFLATYFLSNIVENSNVGVPIYGLVKEFYKKQKWNF